MVSRVENYQHQKVANQMGQYLLASLENDGDALNAIGPQLVGELETLSPYHQRRVFILLKSIMDTECMQRAGFECSELFGKGL